MYHIIINGYTHSIYETAAEAEEMYNKMHNIIRKEIKIEYKEEE